MTDTKTKHEAYGPSLEGASDATKRSANDEEHAWSLGRQEELKIVGPGAEKVQIEEIDRLVGIYVKARDARVVLTTQEVSAKGQLIAALHAHEGTIGRSPDGAIRYRFDDKLVELAPTKEKLRVREENEDEEDSE